MNFNQWNRQLEKNRLEKDLNFNLKIPKKKLNPNCKHQYPDGMALFYLPAPFPMTSDEKIEMVNTCIKCGGKK